MFAQVPARKCATHENNLKKLAADPNYLEKRSALNTPTPTYSNKKVSSETMYTIPIVIHVIHNGEAVGISGNISDEQIFSAITALNNDFRSTNSDTLVPTHPFYSLQADINMEFCLAKQDGAGEPTTGILRYDKGQSSWGIDDFEDNVKPGTIWDITKYLNIWIITFGSPDTYTLGYASLPGWSDPTEVGVVIGATYFGTTGNLSTPYDQNRTATHEVGHFFNLSHIWGDATCGTDNVSDTPTQEGPNTDLCPSFPHNVAGPCSPGPNGEMIMNYMDYTTDACMQMFTTGQKDRMRAAVLLSDRLSLTTSSACDEPSSTTHISSGDFNIYPNPSKNVVSVSAPGHFKIEGIKVYNINGQEMNVTFNIGNRQSIINTASLDNGSYFVTIVGATGTAYKNLIILK